MSDEPIIVGKTKLDMSPEQDIMFKAACERQRKYWVEKMPTLSDMQVALVMDTMIQAVNVITFLDMADGTRAGSPYRSKLGTNLRLIVELLQAPEPKIEG